MNIKFLRSFLKDQITDSIAFFCSNILIGVFYSIASRKRLEILYPFLIVLFIYLVWMLFRFIKYQKLYKGLEEMMKYPDYPENSDSAMNQKISSTMKAMHASYLDRLSDAENKWKKDRRFLSLWIHNMKTPVTVTDLLLQRLQQEQMDITAGTKALKEENGKLLSHLDTVLNMIRLEEFAKDYVPEPIDLIEELRTMINKNKSLFIYNRVFPKIITELGHAEILSDKKWNELMINQLISNGVKYSCDEEGVSKNIYFIIEKADGRVILTIKDEGIGIPEHDLSKIYEPFFTGDNGRKGYQSSGIGLYFCHEVCKLLGHTIEITSEVNKGTSVKITYLAKL